LNREAALRNILGVPPTEPLRLELTSPPSQERLEPRWEELLTLAQERRPDLIELKLIIEADDQSVVIANNQALPQVDAALFYRWNGLEGRTPSGATIETGPGQFTDWTLGVNFSVPLGLRKERAGLRKAELIVQRDRANLDQGLHSAAFSLAESVRNLAQFWEQYLAFKETNAAARINLEVQLAQFKAGRGDYVNVLLAIADWGNAVSAEAQSLTQYNTELANLERETGTILDTHGVKFFEERFRAIGPLGRLRPRRWYPSASPPSPNVERYPQGTEPVERSFGLESPVLPK
jgi:outer membrane protein TolC